MIGNIQFLVFVTFLVLCPAHGDLLNANDAQSCMELCASCEGTSTFENGLCECIVPEGNKLGIECVKRLKRDADNLDLVESSATLGTSERSARCSLLGSRRSLGSADADRIVKYFMNGGPLTGSSLLRKSNTDCSPQDHMIGSSNPKPSHPILSVSEPKLSSSYTHSPDVRASNPSNCATGEYQPMVGTQYVPYQFMGPRMLSATHQPIQGAYYYPQDFLGAVPHLVLEIPNTLIRTTHIPAPHNQGLLRSSPHSPFVSSLATGAHEALLRLSNMIAPYTTKHNHGNIVTSPHATETPCDHSHQRSYPYSNMVGSTKASDDAPNPRPLHEVLAHQNTLLEALSNQLASYNPYVASSPMQYAPMPYKFAPAAPMAQCYYPPAGHSPVVEGANSHESTSKSSSDNVSAVKATNPHDSTKSSKSSSDDVESANPIKSDEVSSEESEENENEPRKDVKKSDDEKPLSGTTEPKEKNESAEEKVGEINKREPRLRSSIRKKRGDVKYYAKKSVASQN